MFLYCSNPISNPKSHLARAEKTAQHGAVDAKPRRQERSNWNGLTLCFGMRLTKFSLVLYIYEL